MSEVSSTQNLREKLQDAKQELEADTPLIALSSEHGIFIASFSASKAHLKVVRLANHPGVLLVFGGRGVQSDLAILKSVLKNGVDDFEERFHGRDLSGRLVAATAAGILRHWYLYLPKVLAVQAVVVDVFDPEDPICAIDCNGLETVGKNFLLSGSKPPEQLDVSFASFEEMQQYALEKLVATNQDGLTLQVFGEPLTHIKIDSEDFAEKNGKAVQEPDCKHCSCAG